jgi:hypothetical protein
MEFTEPHFAYAAAGIFKRFFYSVLTEMLDKIRGVVDGEEKFTVFLPVFRTVEISLDLKVDEPEKFFRSMIKLHQHSARLIFYGAELVASFMVTPH